MLNFVKRRSKVTVKVIYLRFMVPLERSCQERHICQIWKLYLLQWSRHVFVFVKQGCPHRQQSQNLTKSPSPTFWPHPNLPGHVILVKCEQPLHEFTVYVWLLYHQSNFKYYTLFVSRKELQTNVQTDRQTTLLLDDLSDREHSKSCQKTTKLAGRQPSLNSSQG